MSGRWAGCYLTTEEVRRKLLMAKAERDRTGALAQHTWPPRDRLTSTHADWKAAAEEWERVFWWASDHDFRDVALDVANGGAS